MHLSDRVKLLSISFSTPAGTAAYYARDSVATGDALHPRHAGVRCSAPEKR